MVAAIGVVDPLHDDLAPLVLEIDIDVRRLAAFLGDEALEQQVVALGVDGGDAQHIAHRGIGGGAPALAEDVLAPGEADDGVHGQEVGRVFQVSISPSSWLQDRLDLVRHAFRHSAAQRLPRSGPPKGGLGRHAQGRDLVGILVGFSSSSEKRQRSAISRVRARASGYLAKRRCISSAASGAGRRDARAGSQLIDGAAVTHAGDHILQQPALGMVKQHVVGDDGLDAGLAGQVGKVRAAAARRPGGGAGSAPDSAGGEGRLQAPQRAGRRPHRPGRGPGPRSGPRRSRAGPANRDCTWPCPRRACRARAAGRAGRRPAGRSDRPARRMPSIRSSRQPTIRRTPVSLGGFVGADDAGDRVAVDDGQGFDPTYGPPGLKRSSQERSPPQEREVRGRLQLDVAGGLRTQPFIRTGRAKTR